MARGVWELKVLQRRSFHGFRETGRVNGRFFVYHKFGLSEIKKLNYDQYSNELVGVSVIRLSSNSEHSHLTRNPNPPDLSILLLPPERVEETLQSVSELLREPPRRIKLFLSVVSCKASHDTHH